MEEHGKGPLLKQVSELARVELGIRELEPWVRDHVVHALLSFVLGIYLVEEFVEDSPIRAFKLQWKIAGLFHDVGYPVQVSRDLLKPFEDTVNRLKKEKGISVPDIRFAVIPMGLSDLPRGGNSFYLINDLLNDWGLSIDAGEEYDKMIRSGNICHGIISSLAVLYVIDLIYYEHNRNCEIKDIYSYTRAGETNWNHKFFERDIIAACSAIYIHNLPNDRFRSAKIDRKKAPLAFLLKLSDCLQDWERPSKKNVKGFNADSYDITIRNDGRLSLKAPKGRREIIKREIDAAVEAEDIII
jgi:hypothetical protein